MDKIENIFEQFQMDPSLLYDAIVNSTDDYIYIVDMRRDEALVSENMLRDFELPDRLFYGLIPIWYELVHDRDKDLFRNSIDRMLDGTTSEHNVEYQIRNRRGEYVWVLCRGLLKRDPDGVPLLFAGIVFNLGNKGKVDPITGLFTQSECVKKMQKLLELQGVSASGGIMLLGLDNFSTINSLNNHTFGDMVLRSFAQTVQSYLPSDAGIYRFDGDQFAVVCPNASRDQIMDLYNKIHIYYNRRHVIDGYSYFCTVSGGITMIGEDSNNYLDLIKYASSALVWSKETGKNTCTFFSPVLIQSRLRMQELENQLQISAAENMKGFQMYYQPIVDSKNHRASEAEALLRWSCEEFGSISPAEFIPILESNGLIIPVGRWILEQAIATCKEWLQKDENFLMNINVSYLQLLDADFLPFLNCLLKKYKIDPCHLLIEMTESYFVTDMDLLQDTFTALREMGIEIAMDDFGTGYSSLGMLVQLPADVIKIDRAFISMIDENVFHQTFIRAVIELCHSVGIRVCVEGVERNEELKVVHALNADSIQGFHFSKPVPKETFDSLYLGTTVAGKDC